MEDYDLYVLEIKDSAYRGGDEKATWIPLNREKLKESMRMMAEYLAEAMAPLSEGFRDFYASEVEVGLQISAEGKVGLLGTGVSNKGNASVKIKFVRKL